MDKFSNLTKTPQDKCKKLSFQTPDLEVKSGLFEIESMSPRIGISPHMFGIIIHVSSPRTRVYFDPGNGAPRTAGAGHKRIFNHQYRSGKHTACVTARAVPKHGKKVWCTKKFKVQVNPKRHDRVITNFQQGKAAGQTARGAVGLQVAFSIALAIHPQIIEWDFGDGTKLREDIKWQNLLKAHHTYKKKGIFHGYVGVTYGSKLTKRNFTVMVTDI